ncbi:TRAPP I complex [Piedraia hortae CBS 480.64]|uniref:Trafficking protein particle complex subunit BET3 n=1 Tax=Piedraia hortae CBS 480.64 TaxID=1314780 RepID=A0A6A7BW49_9PEZI|nr:TRAPP I complex [Piedraia hortae CBS 480.64]
MASSKAARMGENVWKNHMEKINAEVVTLTYGTIVAQLCRDLTLPNTAAETDYAAVNAELDRMGYQIGLRLIEDFLAKSSIGACTTFRETAEIISKVGFKAFLNITPEVRNWDKEGRSFHLSFDENPLADFVELPDDGRAQDELWYSNILCGVIRGALEMVQMQVDTRFVSDVLRGHDATEMRVALVRIIEDELPVEDD